MDYMSHVTVIMTSTVTKSGHLLYLRLLGQALINVYQELRYAMNNVSGAFYINVSNQCRSRIQTRKSSQYAFVTQRLLDT